MTIVSRPRIGIALAAYQPDPEHLRAQLQSLVDQTHPDWVCHITCDSPITPILSDEPRLVWHQNHKTLGHARNFERAMQLCAADPQVGAIAFCDQDDLWHPTRLAKTAALLQRSPPLSLVHCDLLPFGPGAPGSGSGSDSGTSLWQLERRVVNGATPATEMIRCTVNGNSSLFDADLARKYSNFPSSVDHHDQWLSVLAASHGGIYPLSEPLVHYRLTGKNLSGANPYQGMLSLPRSPLARLRQRYLEFQRMKSAADEAGLKGCELSVGNLVTIATLNWLRDPVLARASAAKALGASLSFLRVAE